MSNTLSDALHHLETTEANLIKLERLWTELRDLTPEGFVFGTNVEYENKARAFTEILGALPNISGWKPTALPMDLDDLAQSRLDAQELGMIETIMSTEKQMESPGSELRDYRFRLNKMRQQVIHADLARLVEIIDSDIIQIRRHLSENPTSQLSDIPEWQNLTDTVGQIDTLLGSNDRPARWFDLRRHLGFAENHDFDDIETLDWPIVRKVVQQMIYGVDDPLPIYKRLTRAFSPIRKSLKKI